MTVPTAIQTEQKFFAVGGIDFARCVRRLYVSKLIAVAQDEHFLGPNDGWQRLCNRHEMRAALGGLPGLV